MADIRVNQLPLATGPTAPMQSDFVPIDGTNTRKATLLSLADVINPPASQAEAEAGTDAVKRMTALTTKQSIASEVGVSLASAAQGLLASSALQPSDVGTAAAQDISYFTTASLNAGFTGSGAYSVKGLLENRLDLVMTAPSFTNGADITASLQALVTAAVAASKCAYIPAHPLGFVWTISSTVNIPAGCRLVLDTNAQIVKNTAGTLFLASGDNVYIDGQGYAKVTHNGAGAVFDTNQKDGIRYLNTWTDVSGSGDAFQVTGSDTVIEGNRFGNFRTNDYVVNLDKLSGHININNRVDRNYFGGPGRVLRVRSSDAGQRPEGWSFSNNKSVATAGTLLQLECFLNGVVLGNMLDQGSNVVINLAPGSTTGFSGLFIGYNYIAAAFGSGPTAGIAINGVSSAQAGNKIYIYNNQIAYSGYGFNGTDNLFDVTISGNAIHDIAANAVQGAADDWTLRDNTYSNCTNNLVLTEGAGGGSITIDNERFHAAGGMSLPSPLTHDRWSIGRTFGKVLRKRANGVAVGPFSSGATVAIPHGLYRAPDPRRISALTCVPVSPASYTDIRASVISYDATNVTVGIYYGTQAVGGTVQINYDATV